MKTNIFIILEAFIYGTFISFDIMKVNFTFLKYLGIILCFIYALISKKWNRSIAMVFTLIADYFLLIADSNYELGVASFIIVQGIYAYYLYSKDKDLFKKHILFRVLIPVIGIIILLIVRQFSLLNCLVMIYFPNEVINCLEAYKADNIYFFIGFVLFICCDVCVGLHNLIPGNFALSVAMWAFYLPSQILIVIS